MRALTAALHAVIRALSIRALAQSVAGLALLTLILSTALEERDAAWLRSCLTGFGTIVLAGFCYRTWPVEFSAPAPPAAA